MIKGLTEEEKFKVIRPIIGDCVYDENGFPVVKKTEIDAIDWNSLKVRGLQNASRKGYNAETLLLMFNYDKRLLSLWNSPLKKVGLFQTFAAVSTPDFSVYPPMNINIIRYNVFMSRWLGRTWQNYGCTVLPTIGWALPDTYDLCFGGIERGSIVVISTLGCQEHKDVFLMGFNEMRKRIDPPLIIVVGKMIEGMNGEFLNFRYEDTFDCKYEQMRLAGINRIFSRKLPVYFKQ
uniref:DUF4417 domain-containing protein n=1 Tax=Eubacterium cellulosolvens (strain ATCC 43171 / JCM 9499 / 6) TaxID=633697 RepID=I5AVI7_EUBC6